MLNSINIFSLSKRINRPLILDGAMGSLLLHKNIKSRGSLWMSYANIENPDAVLSIHKDYIKAGADIITTNTFRTNPGAVEKKYGLSVSSMVRAGVQIALKAAKDLPVFIAGSNAPAEDCYQVERKISGRKLIKNHHTHIDLLYSNGCNFILNETQSHFDEIKIICEYCSKNDMPYIISIFSNDNLKILSGERIKDVVNFVKDYNPLAISFNCILPATFQKIFKNVDFDFNWGFYLNCLPSPKRNIGFAQAGGSSNYTDKVIECGLPPINFGKYITKTLSKKPSFIGACCGSSPAHIRQIKKILDGRSDN
jgi:homocysteine S-methyltransferase